MDTSEPSSAAEDEEEKAPEVRPRTRSNPEGAEDRAPSGPGGAGGQREPVGNRGDAVGNLREPVGNRGEAVGNQREPVGNRGDAVGNQREPVGNRGDAVGNRGEAVGNQREAVGSRSEGEGEAASAGHSPPGPAQPGTAWHGPGEVTVRTPRVNCPEKLIICLDLAEEMALPKLESFNGTRSNALTVAQKMIEMFVRTKHKIDKSHEFALVVVNNDSTWLSGFTSDPREVCSCLYDLDTVVCQSFSIHRATLGALGASGCPGVPWVPPGCPGCQGGPGSGTGVSQVPGWHRMALGVALGVSWVPGWPWEWHRGVLSARVALGWPRGVTGARTSLDPPLRSGRALQPHVSTGGLQNVPGVAGGAGGCQGRVAPEPCPRGCHPNPVPDPVPPDPVPGARQPAEGGAAGDRERPDHPPALRAQNHPGAGALPAPLRRG
uniref:BRISC and BRCA1 A complex member 1 n=1 Tax=Taeniopygia guttata TaxID=59729 RepID=A0A674HVT7_TAEGU